MKRTLIILTVFLSFLVISSAFGIDKEKASKETSEVEKAQKDKSGISQEGSSSSSKSGYKTRERPDYDEFIDKNEDGIDDRAAPRKAPQKAEEISKDSPVKRSSSPKDIGTSDKSSDDTVVKRKSR